ncbi:type 1 glutamine amidotransferase domain-containing protein [Seohaeicola saemankumensis]|uniref:type 1 glutamine amidotransferase domain-containing protein n=1 Tax=Seohaeicola TaxID=481178 RepID=UPI0035CED758
MRQKLAIAAGILTLSVALILVFLTQILSAIGFHPHYERREFDLAGKRALIIATNHDALGDPEDGVATGVYGSELTIAYYEFLDAGMAVDIAGVEGGAIPFEPISLRWPLATAADYRYMADADARNKTTNSLKIADIDVTQYDIIFMAGGWGAAYDLGTSHELGEAITQAYAADILLGSVCHGALGFLMARDIDGSPLVEGRTMTGVTDKQVDELGIGITPQHPERELRAQGANFVSASAFRDFFATYVAVDGNIVTGQNQNSSGETAQKLLALLAAGG